MQRNNVLTIAIDSDVLRSLVLLKKELAKNPKLKVKDSKDFLIKKYGGYLRKMLTLIQQGQLGIYICNTIFQEVRHITECVDFIREYCLLPNLNVVNFKDVLQRTDDLAYKYCNTEYDINGVHYYPPMDKHYEPSAKKEMPKSDAYAMAEAALANCIFVTANGQDYVFRKYIRDDENSRSEGISYINIQEGIFEIVDDKVIAPTSWELHRFGAKLKSGIGNIVVPTANIYEMVEADTLL